MILDKLPANHFKTTQIVKLLEKHTATEPVVDLEFLANNLDCMQVARNYTIKLVQKNAKGEWYSPNHVVAVVETPLDLELLKDAIRKAYKRVKNKIPEPEKQVHAITTAVDDLAGSTERARVNTKSKAKYGKKMESGELTVEKVEDAA